MSQAMNNTLLEKFKRIRTRTLILCDPLETEDYVIQPIKIVSPPKWQLGHTTWFFEAIILTNHLPGYKVF